MVIAAWSAIASSSVPSFSPQIDAAAEHGQRPERDALDDSTARP